MSFNDRFGNSIQVVIFIVYFTVYSAAMCSETRAQVSLCHGIWTNATCDGKNQPAADDQLSTVVKEREDPKKASLAFFQSKMLDPALSDFERVLFELAHNECIKEAATAERCKKLIIEAESEIGKRALFLAKKRLAELKLKIEEAKLADKNLRNQSQGGESSRLTPKNHPQKKTAAMGN